MSGIEWQALHVDDDPDFLRQVKEFFDGKVVGDSCNILRVQAISDFDSALSELESRRIDLLILDVSKDSDDQDSPEDAGNVGAEEGIRIIEAVRATRFVPVVFYTGFNYKVQDMESPVVWVVEKTAGLSKLEQTIEEIFNATLPQTNRALVSHLESVQREYMWGFVAEHWNSLTEESDDSALVHLLAKRLAISLHAFASDEKVHPMLYYLLPPVAEAPLAGDLYQGDIGGEDGYWILITPSCDMVTEKADFMLLARCLHLAEQLEFTKWKEGLPSPSNNAKQRLESLLGNNRRGTQPERFYFLPGALTLPDLVVDFQQLTTMPREEEIGLERIASLDSPFAEEFLARFARYFGRLGTPDLDVDSVMSRLSLQ